MCILSSEEAPVVAETPAPAPVPVVGEPMDIMTALQLVLRKSLAHGGLARGLHEGAKVIEKHAAQLCVLAEDCDQPDYVKLVKALCADHNVNLMTVPSAKSLGEWAGVSIIHAEVLLCFLFLFIFFSYLLLFSFIWKSKVMVACFPHLRLASFEH